MRSSLGNHRRRGGLITTPSSSRNKSHVGPASLSPRSYSLTKSCSRRRNSLVQSVLFLSLFGLYLWISTTMSTTSSQSDLSRTPPESSVHRAITNISTRKSLYNKNQVSSHSSLRRPPQSARDAGNLGLLPYNPFNSTPPRAIPLQYDSHPPSNDSNNNNNNNNNNNEAMDKAIRLRHECISHIRQRQMQQLGTLVGGSQTLYPHILLVDPAYHKNVGDHMITLGEIEFLRRMGYHLNDTTTTTTVAHHSLTTPPLYQCRYRQAGPYVTHCQDILEQEPTHPIVPALWHGGGNWGDLWRPAQTSRIDSFASLLKHNYTILGMPQSLYYSKPDMAESDRDLIQSYVVQGLTNDKDVTWLESREGQQESKRRVTFTWREVESYEEAQRLYPFANNLIVPDIAFQLGPFNPIPSPIGSNLKLDIVLFLRDDKESVVSAQRNKKHVRERFNALPGGRELQFMVVDWADRLELFDSEDIYFTDTSIQLLSLGKVVICDRLHAAILCYISGIPFVYIDQVSGKISKTLRVAFDSWDGCQNGEKSMWSRAENLDDAIRQAIAFLTKYGLDKVKDKATTRR